MERHYFRELLALKRVLLKKRDELKQNQKKINLTETLDGLLLKAKNKAKNASNMELQRTIESILLGREENKELALFIEEIEEKSIIEPNFFDFIHLVEVSNLTKKEKILQKEEKELEKEWLLNYAIKLEILANKLKLQKLFNAVAVELSKEQAESLVKIEQQNWQFYLSANFTDYYQNCLQEINKMFLSIGKQVIKTEELEDYLQQALLTKANEMRTLLAEENHSFIYSENIKVYRHIDFSILVAYTLQKAFFEKRVSNYQARLKSFQKNPNCLTDAFIAKALTFLEMNNPGENQVMNVIQQELGDRRKKLQLKIEAEKAALKSKIFSPQSTFWQRNSTNIITAVGSFFIFLLASISLILVFSGALASLGILMGTTVTGVGIAATFLGGSAALIGGVNTILNVSTIILNERRNKADGNMLRTNALKKLKETEQKEKKIIIVAQNSLKAKGLVPLTILKQVNSEFDNNYNKIIQDTKKINSFDLELCGEKKVLFGDIAGDMFNISLNKSLKQFESLLSKIEPITPSTSKDKDKNYSMFNNGYKAVSLE